MKSFVLTGLFCDSDVTPSFQGRALERSASAVRFRPWPPISLNNLAGLKTRVRISRAYNTSTSISIFTFGVARSIDLQVSQPVLLALAMCCRTSLSSALSSLGTQDHLRVGEGSWPIVICPLRNESNTRFTLTCYVDGFGILHLHNHLYYEIGFL